MRELGRDTTATFVDITPEMTKSVMQGQELYMPGGKKTDVEVVKDLPMDAYDSFLKDYGWQMNPERKELFEKAAVLGFERRDVERARESLLAALPHFLAKDKYFNPRRGDMLLDRRNTDNVLKALGYFGEDKIK